MTLNNGNNILNSTDFEIIDTRITDHWGVDWTPMEIVRDFLQNFYDANPINDIVIKIRQRTVTVSAPAEFDYKSLIYLGSDKGPNDIGQYGEGFKAATVNAMRNHGCIVKAQINSDLLEFFFESEKIGETQKKIVMCKKSKARKIIGTRLVLENCSQAIVDEFKFGLNYFYYESNSLFAEVLTRHYSNDIIVYKSVTENIGYVFYKKLLRAKLDVPLVIVCNRKYKSIDDKIKHDRDRKAFNEDVLELLLKYVFKQINASEIVYLLKSWWQSGHTMLRILASGWGNRNIKFPENYYAKHSKTETRNPAMQYEVDRVESEFREKGYIQCPVYMAHLGMQNAISVVESRFAKKKEEQQTLFTRKPTDLEIQALNFLINYLGNIDPFLTKKFEYSNYIIGDSEELIGQLRLERSYRSRDVYLSKYFFLFSFAEALATLMHEWSHIYGYDGSRGFTDALTLLIVGLINKRDELSDIEKKWNELSLKIKSEQFIDNSILKIYDIIEKLTDSQKLKLLKDIPEEELLKLLRKENIPIHPTGKKCE